MIFDKDIFFTKKFLDSDSIYVKLEKAGYIKQISSGLYAYLDPFNKLLKNICSQVCNIFSEYNFCQVNLPLLQDINLWKNSGRLDIYGSGLFTTGENNEFVINATNEEAIVNLADLLNIGSHQLPFCAYQISERARNEIRPAYGLVRTKTFVLADCYAIVNSKTDAQKYTDIFKQVFQKISKKFNLPLQQAIHLGHENTFSVWSESQLNQSHPILCKNCHSSFRGKEMLERCPICGSSEVERVIGAEIGDIATIKQLIKTKNINNSYIVFMGIGISRLIQLIAENKVHANGFDWDYFYAPYKAYIVASPARKSEAQKIYASLSGKMETIYDDRPTSIGAKLIDADLLGCPYKIIVGKNTDSDFVEIKRNNKTTKINSSLVLQYIQENQ